MSCNLLPLVQAVEQVTGRRVHLSTVIRWCTKGTSGIRLESKVLGGRRYTWIEAVSKFVEETSTAKNQVHHQPKALPPRQQELAANRSAKKLADLLKPKPRATKATTN